MVHDIVQEVVIKTIPNKNAKGKLAGEGALQVAEKRRDMKAKEKRKDTPFWMQNSKE